MSRVIRAFYLDNNRTTAIAIILEVQRVCAANGVKPPQPHDHPRSNQAFPAANH